MERKLIEAHRCLKCNYTLCIYSFDGEICYPPTPNCAICGAISFVSIDVTTLDECKHETKVAAIENSSLN